MQKQKQDLDFLFVEPVSDGRSQLNLTAGGEVAVRVYLKFGGVRGVSGFSEGVRPHGGRRMC